MPESSLRRLRLLDVAPYVPHPEGQFPVAATIKGQAVGLQTYCPENGLFGVQYLYSKDPDSLAILRHSTAHLLARALMRLYPGVQLGFGPSIDTGFYCDFALETQLTPADLPKIETEMRRIIAQGGSFECIEVSHSQAERILEAMDQPLKLEHLNTNLRDLPTVFFYRQGEFLDLSRGPHVVSAGMLSNFRLLSITGSYWKDDPNRPLQRIYGTAWFKPEELNRALYLMEKAKERDHRILGRQLELYAFDPRVGAGLVLWLPKGAVLREQLETFLAAELTQRGFQRVYTPEIGRVSLYRMQGNNPLDAESLYPVFEAGKNDSFVLRPTCGPHHVTIYQNHPRSYRELPLRFFEFGNVCSFEPSGELSGLKRVRAFTRNDSHVFCPKEQAAEEFERCLDLLRGNLRTFGFKNLRVQTLFRSENGVKYSGSLEQWQWGEEMILSLCRKLGIETFPGGEVHPEGPGIDFVAEDSLGRDWHFGIIHIDFKLPADESFGLSYVGTDNRPHEPVVLHCTPLDSFERFIGVLIEHFAGAFPLWLAPEQVRILPVSPKFEEYAQEIEAQLRAQGFRVQTDCRSEKIGAKIRRAQIQLVPYMVIIGEREASQKTLAIRDRISGNLGNFTLEKSVEMFLKEIREKTLKYEPGTV